MMNDDHVSRLLRLKRYEQPPEGFHEEFLREFRRRQRAAHLQPSFFDRMWQGLHDRLSMLTPATYAYASVLVMAVAVSSVMLTEDVEPSSSPAMAAGISLNSTPPVDIPDSLLQRSRQSPQSIQVPAHYVLESRPVSYDAPFSF